MLTLLLNRYIIAFTAVYAILLVLLVQVEDYPIGNILAILVILGLLFTSVAYLLSKNAQPVFLDRIAQKHEAYIIGGFIIYLIVFLTYYKTLLISGDNSLFNTSESLEEIIVGFAKVIFLVIIPISIYKFIYGFSLKDWGISHPFKSYLSRRSFLIFVVFLFIIIPFQYFAGNGAKPVREGIFSVSQLLISIPISYIWLILVVGIVEEFYFRAFLQSRLSVILKSDVGGVIISAVIFGLAHAPGLYLRGSGQIANIGLEPSLLLSIGYSFLVLSVAGFFLSVIWLKTKNFWLIVAIHALVDLLPGLPEFITIFAIK